MKGTGLGVEPLAEHPIILRIDFVGYYITNYRDWWRQR